MSSAEAQIKKTLEAYRDALVASDASACASLYARDGVVMAQGFPTQVGHANVSAWYKLCFSLIQLDVEFSFHEIVVVSDKYGFARTSSAGTQKMLSTGHVSNEGNQELFVMAKEGNDWKIGRYCFSTTNGPE
jgi:ketosteroid isomerase-like protein